MKNEKDVSRRKTPWDNKEDATALQQFIRDKYKDNYDKKHPKLFETDESKIFNSIKITKCPYCNSETIQKKGFNQNKVQRYFCTNCRRRFTPTTNTIFENHKIPITEWIEFSLDILNYSSTHLTSKVNKNSSNTSDYWLHKLFLLLREYQQNVVLSGNVYIDEMFYKKISSEIEITNKKQLRGLSKNQYCIGVAYNGIHIIAICEGTGKPSKEKTRETFISHIKPNSTLIHDSEKSHNVLVKELNLKEKKYKSKELKGLKDSDNPMRSINHQIDLIKKFLNSHSGFDRNDLQDYLNLYCFMNNGAKSKLEKVEELLNLALTTNITLKYRNYFEAKEDE